MFFYCVFLISSIPGLTLPLVSDSFVLQTDASHLDLGAALSIIRDDDELPTAYWSRKL